MGADATTRAIDAFWACVRSRLRDLEDLTSADDPAYDAVLEVLQRIDPGLYFAVSRGSDDRDFIVSAEGNRALFDLVERVVAKAPRLPGWAFFALKPKLGFPEQTAWEGFTIRPAEIVFESPVSKDGAKLALRLYVPGLDPARTEETTAALLQVLDAALGERAFAEKIADIFVRPLPDDLDPDDLIPLLQLEDYLAWRDRKARGG